MEFTICRVTFGNGFLIGMIVITTKIVPIEIPRDLIKENSKYKEAVRGPTLLITSLQVTGWFMVLLGRISLMVLDAQNQNEMFGSWPV